MENVSVWVESACAWMVSQVEAWGYTGIFVMMFLESTFVPFPSEVAMIPAGFLASRDRMDLAPAILAGLAGSLAGALFNYWLARVAGVPLLRRWGKYVFFDEAKLERCNAIFLRHGEVTTFVCRLVPVVRQYISLPAGIAGMPLARFALYTGLGAGIWVAVLALFGFAMGKGLDRMHSDPSWAEVRAAWEGVKGTVYIGTGVFLAAVIGGYVFYTRRRRARRAPATDGEH